MQSFFWKVIDVILIFFKLIENNLYISLASLVKVKFNFIGSKKAM